MYYYSKHIGDYRSATAHLDLLHHGVYQYLMETCYMNEQPLPIEVAKVCRLCGARTQEEKEAVQNILDEFFTLTEKGWVNSRVEKEINAYHANSDKNRANGAKGGRPRKNKTQNNPVGFDLVSSGLENDANSKPNQKATINHKPLTNNHEPITSIYSSGSSNACEEKISFPPIQFSQYQAEDHKRYSILECVHVYPIHYDFIELGKQRNPGLPEQDLIAMFTNFGDFFSAKSDSKNTPSLWLVKWFTWIQNNKDEVRRLREAKSLPKKQKSFSNSAGRTQSEVSDWMSEIGGDDQPAMRDVHEVEGGKYA